MLNFQQMEIFMEKYLEILSKCRLFENMENENITAMLDCLGAEVHS